LLSITYNFVRSRRVKMSDSTRKTIDTKVASFFPSPVPTLWYNGIHIPGKPVHSTS
jgi:hypothetical protein